MKFVLNVDLRTRSAKNGAKILEIFIFCHKFEGLRVKLTRKIIDYKFAMAEVITMDAICFVAQNSSIVIRLNLKLNLIFYAGGKLCQS